MEAKEWETIYKSELEYVRDNPEYFVRTYGHIENKDSDEVIVPFKLWQAQAQALQDFRSYRRCIVLKARQLGISWLVLHYAAWLMLHPGKTIIGMSQAEEQAKELIRRMAFVILKYMPSLLQQKGNLEPGWKGIWYEQTALTVTIHFPGNYPDSKMACFASSENAPRSFTADLLIFDEWAFQQFDRQIWAAAYPTINRAHSGQVIGVSTIKRGSLFEDLWTSPSNSFRKIFIPWYADPSRDQHWYEETKANLADPATMTAEYPASEEEALTVPGGAFFPEVTDESILSDELLHGSLNTYVSFDYGLDMLAAYWIQRDAYGNAQIVQEYCKPNLTIGAAAQTILDLSRDYDVRQFLAPPDLWNRGQESGKSRAIIFQENGLTLTKVNNDIAAGCSAIKEYLKHSDGGKGKLTIYKNCAPELLRCLKKIQRDDKKPNIYANKPHDLTHSVDGLRYWCVYWTLPAESETNAKHIHWRPDMWEDYDNASAEEQAMLIERWGEPD